MTLGAGSVVLYDGTVTITSNDDAGYPINTRTGTVLTRSPTTLIDSGKTLAVGFAADTNVTDYSGAPISTYSSTLSIGGFSSDPGQYYFSYAKYDGTTSLLVADATYEYSSGTATWTWATLFEFYGTTGSSFKIVR